MAARQGGADGGLNGGGGRGEGVSAGSNGRVGGTAAAAACSGPTTTLAADAHVLVRGWRRAARRALWRERTSQAQANSCKRRAGRLRSQGRPRLLTGAWRRRWSRGQERSRDVESGAEVESRAEVGNGAHGGGSGGDGGSGEGDGLPAKVRTRAILSKRGRGSGRLISRSMSARSANSSALSVVLHNAAASGSGGSMLVSRSGVQYGSCPLSRARTSDSRATCLPKSRCLQEMHQSTRIDPLLEIHAASISSANRSHSAVRSLTVS